jgi:hypothetical protein
MKTYRFRISQDLEAYYNAEVTIKASSEKAARNKLEKMSTQQLDAIATNWEQVTDDAQPVGEITVQECIDVNDE